MKNLTEEPVLLKWKQYRHHAASCIPDNACNRLHQLEYPALVASDFTARLIELPAGLPIQRILNEEAIFLGVENSFEFIIDDTTFKLNPCDLLCIPAQTVFSYATVKPGKAIMLSTIACPFSSADSTTPLHRVKYMQWEASQAKFQWTLPLALQDGYHRGSGPYVALSRLRGHTVRIPAHQKTPWHHIARDMYFMPLHGVVEFSAANKIWPLRPRDLLWMPAGVPYQYGNVSEVEAVFYSMGGKPLANADGAYYSEDPGWPIRDDARRLSVEIDAHGNAQLR